MKLASQLHVVPGGISRQAGDHRLPHFYCAIAVTYSTWRRRVRPPSLRKTEQRWCTSAKSARARELGSTGVAIPSRAPGRKATLRIGLATARSSRALSSARPPESSTSKSRQFSRQGPLDSWLSIRRATSGCLSTADSLTVAVGCTTWTARSS